MPENKTEAKTLRQRVAKWLGEEGYPLEFRAADVFRTARYEVRQGQYVRDPETNLPREIDVLAVRTVRRKKFLVRACHVVECKYSRDKPWIVFSSPHGIAPGACITQTIANHAGHATLWALAGHEELQSLDLFSTPDHPGFGGRQAFSKGVDVFYSAMQSVISASFFLMRSYDDRKRSPRESLAAGVVAFPVIVLDGVLFEASFDRGADKIDVQEVDRVRLHWRGAEYWSLNATVDVVTIGALQRFARRRHPEVKALLSRMAETLRQIHECFEKHDFSPLTVTPGARGVIGLPPLLAQLYEELPPAKKTAKEDAEAGEGDA